MAVASQTIAVQTPAAAAQSRRGSRMALAVLLVGTALLYLCNLSSSGWANVVGSNDDRDNENANVHPNNSGLIQRWVERNFTPTQVGAVTLYDLTD